MSRREAWEARRARLDKTTGRAGLRFAQRRLDSAAAAVEEECLLMSRLARDLDELEDQVLRLAGADLPGER